jgi:hypothetical protein
MLVGYRAFAAEIEINPEYVAQREYKITRPMPCDWNSSDLRRTTVFGYYDNSTPELFQVDLQLPHMSAFGLQLNMEFTPEMWQHDGMPLKRLVVDYQPLNKQCTSGFEFGQMSKDK